MIESVHQSSLERHSKSRFSGEWKTFFSMFSKRCFRKCWAGVSFCLSGEWAASSLRWSKAWRPFPGWRTFRTSWSGFSWWVANVSCFLWDLDRSFVWISCFELIAFKLLDVGEASGLTHTSDLCADTQNGYQCVFPVLPCIYLGYFQFLQLLAELCSFGCYRLWF